MHKRDRQKDAEMTMYQASSSKFVVSYYCY